MKLKEDIQNYKPYNHQEEQDKEKILAYLDQYDDILYRSNKQYHFSVSAWVSNATFDYVLMVHHNIYQSYSWSGGHADGNEDLQQVIRKEIEEETGLSKIKQLGNIFSIEILPVQEHIKNGCVIEKHEHLNVTYFFQGDEEDVLRIKEDENSDVIWMKIEDIHKRVKEKHMLSIYDKLIHKMHMFQ